MSVNNPMPSNTNAINSKIYSNLVALQNNEKLAIHCLRNNNNNSFCYMVIKLIISFQAYHALVHMYLWRIHLLLDFLLLCSIITLKAIE